jgi:spore maturation protein A
MSMFLAINTSSVTLVPFTIIGLRVAAGSTNAAQPMAGIIFATVVSTTVAIIAARTFSRLPRYALPAEPTPEMLERFAATERLDDKRAAPS